MAPIVVTPYDPSWPTHFQRISRRLDQHLSSASVPYTSITHIGSTSIIGLAAKPIIDIVILVPNAELAEKARDALMWINELEDAAYDHAESDIQARFQGIQQHEVPQALNGSADGYLDGYSNLYTPGFRGHYYKSIGNGGIKGRISMKYSDWEAIPGRCVYIISEEDEEGMLGLRGYEDLKRCLSETRARREVEARDEKGVRIEQGGEEEDGDAWMEHVNEDLRKGYEDVKWAMVNECVVDGVEYGQRKNEVIRKILKRVGWKDEAVDQKENLDTRIAGGWREDAY